MSDTKSVLLVMLHSASVSLSTLDSAVRPVQFVTLKTYVCTTRMCKLDAAGTLTFNIYDHINPPQHSKMVQEGERDK